MQRVGPVHDQRLGRDLAGVERGGVGPDLHRRARVAGDVVGVVELSGRAVVVVAADHGDDVRRLGIDGDHRRVQLAARVTPALVVQVGVDVGLGHLLLCVVEGGRHVELLLAGLEAEPPELVLHVAHEVGRPEGVGRRVDGQLLGRGGVLLADLGDNGNHRQYLTLKQISPYLIKGTIDVEDKNFYRNAGFDVTGIARAAYDNFRHQKVVGGGSTITQQLAKQLLLTPEQSYNRKVKEVVLAYELSQTYSKDQILELYLNHSYYGEQAYGVEAAARVYFQKDAKDLTPGEATMLAGIPQAPTDWDPITHVDLARARQQEV
ncbi:MAG: hypothetical protein E6J00_14560, partial [Chloroflexi bacterium]